MPSKTSQSILQLFFRRRTAGVSQTGAVGFRFLGAGFLGASSVGLGFLGLSALVPAEGFAATPFAIPAVRVDDATDLAAAQKLLEAGQAPQALQALLQLRASSPQYAAANDVDYFIVISALRSGQNQVAWDSGQTWRAAQPKSVVSPPTGGDAKGETVWAARQEMAAQVFLAQVQAAYRLALAAGDLPLQQQWLTSAETVGRELQSLRPSVAFQEPLDYHLNLIALQQELRRNVADAATDSLTTRRNRFQELATQFRSTADRATGAEWQHKNRYYAAVAAEMAGDLTEAILLWDGLQKDATVDTEIRRLSLLALAESNLNRWFATAPTATTTETEQETRQQWLFEARDRYQQLQREHAGFDPVLTAFQLGTCYRLLEDHTRAIEQFQKISWPPQPASDLGAAYWAWLAQYNQARSFYSLQQYESARQVLDLALPRLQYATDGFAGQAILLRMRIAEQAADWPLIIALRQDGETWLKQIPDQQPEVEYLTAVAQFQAVDASAKAAGAQLLTTIAGQANHPWSDMAKLQLLPWQVEPETARHISSRISFDQATSELKERLQAAVVTADQLLSSPMLKADEFPVNPALLLPAQLKVLDQRKQVRQSQANALYRLGEHAQASVKFGDLLRDFPNDAAVADWTMRRAVSLAQSTSPAMALAQLTEALLQTWPSDMQAQGWWLRGELFRLQKDEVAATQAYEKSLSVAVAPTDKLMAMKSALGSVYRLANPAESVRLINQWEKDFNGSTLLSLILQRGIAHYSLKDFPQAEVDFAKVLSLASGISPQDDADQSFIAELTADAQVNQGLALQEQGKVTEAKQLWENFLAQHAQHASRDQVTGWIKAIDPQWQAPSADAAATETSGSDREPLEQRIVSAFAAFEKQQWSQASAAFQSLAADATSDARHDQVLYFWGWALREQDQLADAKKAWEQLLSLHLNSPWAARGQFHLGEAEYRDGNYTRAAERFQLAKSAATETSLRRSAVYMEAWSDLQQKEYAAAKEKFQSIIDEAKPEERELPLVLEAYALVGQSDFQAGRMAEAWSAYQSAASAIDKLETLKPEMHFQVCFNAGRAAIEVDKATEALPWLGKCLTSIDSGKLPATIDESMQAEAKFLLGVARRLTKDLEGATTVLTPLSSRADTVGLRALLELALIARGRGDERSAQRNYRAIANGAYGDPLSSQALEWKNQALLEMGLSLLRMANQEPDAAVRAEQVRQAKTWLTRAQLQTDSAILSQQATEQLNQLKRLGL